ACVSPRARHRWTAMQRQHPARPEPTPFARRRPAHRRRPSTPQPSTTDLITLIRFEWTTKSGSQPVLFVERRLLD
ncbi:MAG: hypothetical protein ACJ77U_00845, partial [Chloroflexota bacterium]